MQQVIDALLERDLLTRSDVARAIEVGDRAKMRLPAAFVRLGIVAEMDLAAILAEQANRPLASREELQPDQDLLARFNRRFLARNSALPLGLEDGQLKVAMADPYNIAAAEALEFAAALPVNACVATFSDIEEALRDTTGIDGDLGGLASDFADGAADDVERLLEGDSEAPVIRLVQQILTQAVNRRASDVHIEPMARYLAVRFRIDGRLVEVDRHPDSFTGPVASRIKVMAGLDIAGSRLPQDGRLRLTVKGRDVDVRVSTSPTAWGESIVLRLLGRSEVPLDLDRLGLPRKALDSLHRALDRPHGIILLTGPTGSGKTTTLYAAINRLRRPEVKILTVEDPVEVLLEGVNQVQVRPEIELSYAATLRAFLRQDPDVLMIGEIRDHETAEIALRAALTGHLVLSTLHTNSAIGAFTRLADIGVEPYLTASTVIATIAQRLIRSLCEDCKVARAPHDAESAHFGECGLDAPAMLFAPQGCPRCQQSGFAGRIPLIEILEVDEDLRSHIRNGTTEDRADERHPSETLRGHGLALVAAGRTTFAEIERAVQLT